MIDRLIAAWLTAALLVLSAVTLDGLRSLLSPLPPLVTTEAEAATACMRIAQDQLNITHRQVDGYTILHTSTAPRRGVYWQIEYQADGRAYLCDLARGIQWRWFLVSLYVR